MDPRYPIGQYTFAGPMTAIQRQQLIDQIEEIPAKLRAAVEGLSPPQLDTPYRPGGWTVRQVIHHLPRGLVDPRFWGGLRRRLRRGHG